MKYIWFVLFFLFCFLLTSTAYSNPKISYTLERYLNPPTHKKFASTNQGIKVIVVLDFDHLTPLSDDVISHLDIKVQELGGRLGKASYNKVQVWINKNQLETLAEWDLVKSIREPTAPQVDAVISEGTYIDSLQNWAQGGLDGAGVKVGVLDLGFEGAPELLGSELPVSMEAVRTGTMYDFNSTVHGTACAEIIYDIAPGASLYGVNVADMDVDYSDAVNWLKDRVDIISSSMGLNLLYITKAYYDLFSSFSTYNAVRVLNDLQYISDLDDQINDIASRTVAEGITWVQSAGNSGKARWKGSFYGREDNWHDFSVGDEFNEVSFPDGANSYFYIILLWGLDSYDNRTTDDYDLCITNQNRVVIAKSQINQNVIPYGIEVCRVYPNSRNNYYVSIYKYSGNATDLMLLVGYKNIADLEYNSPDRTIRTGTPNDNPHVITVGAVPHYNSSNIEPFSNQGPGRWGKKPDIVAPDAVSTVSYGPNAFKGTSASAPFVAGVSALIKQKYPSYSPAEIKTYLEQHAVDLGEPGKDNIYGSGLVSLPATQTAQTLSLVKQFVGRFYQECLSREPDPGGESYWVQHLINNTLTGEHLAHNFIFSSEFINRDLPDSSFVTILYKAFFDRDPDPGGYQNWIAHLYSGTTRLNVLSSFTKSEEFQSLCSQYGISPY